MIVRSRPADVTPSRTRGPATHRPAEPTGALGGYGRWAQGPAETKVLPDPDLGRCGSTSPRATLQEDPVTRDSGGRHEALQERPRPAAAQPGRQCDGGPRGDGAAGEIDTDRDRELLAKVGLTHDQLMGRLASASIRIIG